MSHVHPKAHKERGQKKNGIMWEKFPKGGVWPKPTPYFSLFSNSRAYKMAKKTVKNVKIPKLGGGGEGVRHLGFFPT